MSPEEYAAAQLLISAAVVRHVRNVAGFFAQPALTMFDWLRLLDLLFPEIQRRRTEASVLARRFYDSQRAQHHPDLPRNDRPLEGTTFEKFVENMDPARERMQQADTRGDALTHLTLRAVREVENAGRQQIIHAVENDPEPRVLRGWARVATGRETCAWCLMLISRGPTYVRAETAGLDLDTEHALELFENNDQETYFADISGEIKQWHTGCDCKVIPVFRNEDWFGKEAADRALDLWGDATKEAIDLEDKGLVHKSGKKKGQPFTRNELAINALRRRLERGEISAQQYAALAA
ncbi:capsid maturation protease [Mycobacterium phage Rohr]|uniref:Capsid maturation protease n=1 Tax=Mycobacterium phage Museum TaxID=2922214 RepID=G1D4N7_9CAUD|nr:head maturation protease [Mycobacterium phage Museum]AVJ50394.1 capsid maturation protease [Mycobacterium phage MPlant7149]AXH43612.1 capsid maturation protease [Mycobacterium phage BigMau]AXH44961.1 capsid maturation protease [Mycobacterium phage Rohr]AXH65961.1 capsid maturation protease [Mycobacterium phage Pita2]AXH67940.1 capsid maturation protease [Mycobacterium phage Sibs6]QNJ56582.1 capsid maturation protease [Mycobacterium phage Jerm2]QYW07375.1 capsid maturation protease [Mycoba